MVAMPVLLLLQIPPVLELVSVLVLPIQLFNEPDIVPGSGLIVATFTALHPVLIT
jgi:hypothetical protein